MLVVGKDFCPTFESTFVNNDISNILSLLCELKSKISQNYINRELKNCSVRISDMGYNNLSSSSERILTLQVAQKFSVI